MKWHTEFAGLFSAGKNAALPFSFTYDGLLSASIPVAWSSLPTGIKPGRKTTRLTGVIPDSGLKVICDLTVFNDFPASEWLLSFENTSAKPSRILENINVLDYLLTNPLNVDSGRNCMPCDTFLPPAPTRPEGMPPFILHSTNGAPSDPSDFEVSTVALHADAAIRLHAGGGRSSNHDFPFFRLDCGRGAAIIAVGWSGQWQSTMHVTPDGSALRLQAGMEHARFYLNPGERVRMPRILMLTHQGDRNESHSVFRRLLRRFYIPGLRGGDPGPYLYCNTCFTRKGGWLNECNEQNQVSLIKALHPLGVQAVITDAGWFTGGWPEGAGNWDPDPLKYPHGMQPVAKAAADAGMIYGLWFEPERVVNGTTVHREHPEWILWSKNDQKTGLLNFGLPAVQEYFFSIVDRYMRIPGFQCYRQDFNMDPLAWWRDNDQPDREGITEIRYIEGLYAYWKRLRDRYPDAFTVNCASGGRRIDLESIQYFNVHQKSDFWFDNTTDQSSLYGLGQYLPNGIAMTPIDRLDDTTFHSVCAASLCLGWIADSPDFDLPRALQLVDIYRRVRHLANKDWYPLTPYSRKPDSCLAVQYNSPETAEGMLLIFRRSQCPDTPLTVSLSGLNPEMEYQLSWHSSGRKEKIRGAALMKNYTIQLPAPGSSELIHYTAKT